MCLPVKQLLLKDFLLTRTQLAGFCVILLLFSAIHYPIIFFYFILALSLPHNLFIDESKYKVNHYLLSLPLNSSKIVKGRYIYLLSAAFFLIIFVWGVSAVTSLKESSALYIVYGSTVYSWQDILISLSIILIVFAVCLPFIYWISSSVIVHAISLITGLLSLALIMAAVNAAKSEDKWLLSENMMNWFREWVPLSSVGMFIIGIATYFISMKVSELLVSKK